MEHVWSVLCSSSSLDKDTNRLSLLDLVEAISIFKRTNIPNDTEKEGITGIPVTFTVVSLIWRSDLEVEEEEGNLRVQILSPEGNLLELEHIPTVKINLTGEYKRFRSRVGFQGIPYSEDGIYRFIVQLRSTDDDEWETVAKVPLEILTVPNPNE